MSDLCSKWHGFSGQVVFDVRRGMPRERSGATAIRERSSGIRTESPASSSAR